MNLVNKSTVQIQPLTPIWTGNMNGHADRELCLSGLMGSLRWWWEILERGVSARIPNIDQLDQKNADPVSKVFGLTGQRRAFRMLIGRSALTPAPINKRVRPEGTQRGWFFPSDAQKGDFQLEIISLRRKDHEEFVDPWLIAELLGFISKFGAIRDGF